MTKSTTSKRTRRAAKKLFAKLPHSTRAFTAQDYQNLPQTRQGHETKNV
jgi:hypothetical protein